MPDEQIEKAIEMAKKINALVILDVQIGQSTIQNELPLLEKYLKLPQVHLAIDPEFSMKFGRLPGILCWYI
jgi:3-keto-L-gulonate-6-phosphate decarboxylase